MTLKKFIYLAFFLVLCSPILAQANRQKTLDSLELVLFKMNASDTANIIKAGTYILENSSSDSKKFKVLQKIAETYFRANNITKSIDYSFKAKEIAEKLGDPERMAQAYGSIANQYSYLNLSDKARPYLNQAMQQIDMLPAGDKKQSLKALSYLELGNLEFNIKNYAGANRNYKQSLQQINLIKRINRDVYTYRRSLYNIGNSYYYLNQPDSAESYLLNALNVKDPERPNLKYFIYSTLAEVYALKGSHQRAIDTLNAILIDPKFDITSLKMEIFLNLSRNYEKIGDRSNYTLYNEKHLSLRDTIEGHELKAIGTAFNVEQKDFSESIFKTRQHNKWLWYGIIVLIITGGAAFLYQNRKKKIERRKYLSLIEKLNDQMAISVQTEPDEESEPKVTYSVPANVEQEILTGLRKFEDEEKYRNPKLNLSMLALSLNTNPAYLSSVIKAQKGKNFNNYINELRIRYICNKIHTDRDYGNYKISYLAEDCGFISHSAFSTVFKKVTGISPSVFLNEEGKRHIEI